MGRAAKQVYKIKKCVHTDIIAELLSAPHMLADEHLATACHEASDNNAKTRHKDHSE